MKYDKLAEVYDFILKVPPFVFLRESEDPQIRKFFAKVLKKNHTVLELGAGTGYYTFDIAKRTKSVFATDISKKMLDKFKEKGIPDNVKIGVLDVNKLPTNKKYDVVACFGVFEYVEDFPSVFDKISKVCKKYFIFTAPANTFPMQLYAMTFGLFGAKIVLYSKKQMETLLEKSGFKAKITFAGNKDTLIVLAEKHNL